MATPNDLNITASGKNWTLQGSTPIYDGNNPTNVREGAGGFFASDFENDTLNETFFDVNTYGGIIVALSTDFAHTGTKSCKVSYPVDEAGVELRVAAFPAIQTLFCRKYEYYAAGWEGNWPLALKTSRFFNRSDYKNTDGYAYCSEKLLSQQTSGGGNTNSLYVYGMNNAIFNLDLMAAYLAEMLFGNSLPYIRTGHWYRYETWLVMNSAVDVADGVMEEYIDGVKVYDNQAVMYKSTARGVPNGDGWQSMWFGGNYSGKGFGGPDETVHRYIDDVYLSTTKDLI